MLGRDTRRVSVFSGRQIAGNALVSMVICPRLSCDLSRMRNIAQQHGLQNYTQLTVGQIGTAWDK